MGGGGAGFRDSVTEQRLLLVGAGVALGIRGRIRAGRVSALSLCGQYKNGSPLHTHPSHSDHKEKTTWVKMEAGMEVTFPPAKECQRVPATPAEARGEARDRFSHTALCSY